MSQTTSYLVVRLSDRLYALPLAHVMETCRVPPLQPAGNQIPSLLGLTQLRGALTPVLDLAVLLNELSTGHSPEGRLVSIRVDSQCFALQVDEVVGIRLIDPAAVTSIPLPGAAEQRMGAFDNAFATLIESSGLLTGDARAAIAQTAIQAAA